MMFGIDNDWVSTLWEAVKEITGKKQDKIAGQDGQVVGFRNGEPAAQNLDNLIGSVWPDGPYTFEISNDGYLFAHYTGINSEKKEE